MGYTKKKKQGRGGRRNKGRAPLKDHSSLVGDSSELIADELTALNAIFQEDCKVVSESPPQVDIKLRPYSKDSGYEDLDVSALLSIRFLPGYPYKCPKLQITPEKGLLKIDTDNLLSLLHDLANSNAREGRVMIYNLVEAAQEFLSEIIPLGVSHESFQKRQEDHLHDIYDRIMLFVSDSESSFQPNTFSSVPTKIPMRGVTVPYQATENSNELFLKAKDKAVPSNKTFSSRGPFVYGFVDLYGDCGESWHCDLGVEENIQMTSLMHNHAITDSRDGCEILDRESLQSMNPVATQDAKPCLLLIPEAELGILEEGHEDESKNSGSSRSPLEDSVDTGTIHEDLSVEENLGETDDGALNSDSSSSLSFCSVIQDQISHPVRGQIAEAEAVETYQLSQTMERDLIMAHLLRLACTPKGPLADALLEITSDLCNLGIVSEWVQDLATKPSSLFDRTFQNIFAKRMVSSKIPKFWKTAADFGGQSSSSILSSRYLNDFEELRPLGHGGFGHVVLCKNKLDGRQYAVKKIRLKDKSPPVNDRILREVATLSRLQHQHVVRYYQAWFETGIAGCFNDTVSGSRTAVGSCFSYKDASSSDNHGHENKFDSTYLYIQMEYCPRTLRQMFESYTHFDKELVWHLFRQIVEGLAHIHGQGIIHRDLTPNNIFFDARNDIKIGDFGLAKFLRLEQVDQDVDPPETVGVSIDGTGQVGTYFYTAPEIEQGWPKINEKADMYSLGIIFLELWHPFDTGMERHVVLSNLKQKRELPSGWLAEFPEQASLLQQLMSPIPSDRPSATELLQNAFPPRMESELLDNILNNMHTSEDTSIYDKIVNAIFEEDMLNTKEHHEHGGRLKLARNDNSSTQFTGLNTDIRDQVTGVTAEVFRQHCAKRLEISPMRLLGDCPNFYRNTVKLLTHGGDMIELCHELRLPFVKWIIENQKSSVKRYEISSVYRRAVGHSPPNRYLQGDFDIIGGASTLTVAEAIKATLDIVTRFFNSESCDLLLNHGDLLDAIWLWIGIKAELRQKVAELLSLLGSLRPQSPERKSKWVVIRRQLRQELNLAESALNRLQTVGLRFCGVADQALARLRGALPADKSTRKALDELSELLSYLRVWRIDHNVFIDSLMPPTESYHRNLFFQIFLRKENNPGSPMDGTLLAVGGCYDHLLHYMWDAKSKSNPPSAVGTSLALETIIQGSSVDIKPLRNDISNNILICSRGGGGLLEERMELVAELWEENIKAEFVPMSDPSLTEQYEYASEHDIKCLVIITDTGMSQKGSVKVRHLELKREKEVERENLFKFLSEALATQFRNPSMWISA